MADFFSWLTGGSLSAIIFIVLASCFLASVFLIYTIAFLQGREVSFWPPKIGKRPDKIKLSPAASPASEVPSCKAVIFENYRQIDWAQVLDEAKTLDIAVVFWASWVKAHWEKILKFYKRGGRVRLILTDPNLSAIDLAWKKFPRYTRGEFIQRVEETVKNFQLALQESQPNSGSFETYFFNTVLNYAVIRVDDKKLFLSFYEHTNKVRICAPSFLLDLEASPGLKEYWNGEFEALLENSRQIDPRHYVKPVKSTKPREAKK
jgi:hypothetical protein